MTFTQLKTYLATYILRRPELLASDDLLLNVAVNAGHKQIQLDGDFRCMEQHATLVMPAGSVEAVKPSLFAMEYKRARSVWNTSAGVRTSPIIASTETEVVNLKSVIKQTRGLDSVTTQEYFQRWFERELGICLMIPPAVSTTVLVDYYAFLPEYVLDSDTDYFSQNYWLCLLYGAAAQASVAGFEDARAGVFSKVYEQLLGDAVKTDAQYKSGGIVKTSPAAPHGTGG